MNENSIIVYGAGISGLVAAICLAEQGFDVEVRESRSSVGGSQDWHPSVHHQVFDLRRTEEYLQIEIGSCFLPVDRHTFYFYGREKAILAPNNSYVCEKGRGKRSIETHLRAKAEKAGVQFAFGQSFDGNAARLLLRPDAPKCIVATGLEHNPYKVLGIRSKAIQGFAGKLEGSHENSVMSFLGNYTNHEFAYAAWFDGLAFSLLFSRRGVNRAHLSAFKDQLLKTQGLVIDDWHFSSGRMPVEMNLVKNGAVLAGTISGMIDPFLLNGISGALVSGRIAAMFFSHRDRAFREFYRVSRYFQTKLRLHILATKLPLKKLTFPILCLLNDRLRTVGVI